MKEVRIQTLDQIKLVDQYGFEDIHRTITQVAGDRLVEFAREAAELENGTQPSDDELIQTAKYYGRQYNFFIEDSQDAQSYLGSELGRPNSRIKPNVGSAKDDFYDRFSRECDEVGVPEEDRERLALALNHSYSQMIEWVNTELVLRTEMYTKTTEALRNPDPHLLREELSVRTNNTFNGLLNQIRAYGERPASGLAVYKSVDTVAAHVPQVATRIYTQTMFDAQIDVLINAYRMPNYKRIIMLGIRSGFVQAAKEAFGEEIPVLDKGLESDPDDLFDPYEELQPDQYPKRARLPSEMVRTLVEEYANQVLYGDISPISQKLDTYGDTFKQNARADRRQLALQSSQNDPNYIVKLDSPPIILKNDPFKSTLKVPEDLPSDYWTSGDSSWHSAIFSKWLETQSYKNKQ